jgi:aspartate-semialdehyde dehydrogenase
MKVAVVGITGLVGKIMVSLLKERNFPVSELIPVASERSIGNKVEFQGKKLKIRDISEAIQITPELALFSAGRKISLIYAPKFSENGTTVIDNSSAWRMNPNIKLIIPEINANILTSKDKIIANPNCSTIQMLMALAPLHYQYKVKRIVVSTYQSVSGTGVKAVRQLENERKGIDGEKAYPHPIDKNCLPHCDDFSENGYSKEELKLINETRKIFNDPSIQITATAVRVPVLGGHSESVNVEFEKGYNLKDIPEILSTFPGIVVQDKPGDNQYPMPINVYGKDEVFIGRIRRDFSRDNTLNIWIVADNLRKGAATNAIQIAEYLIDKKLI